MGILACTKAHNDHIHIIIYCPLDAGNHPTGITKASTVQHPDSIEADIRGYTYHANIIPLGSDDTCHMGAMAIIILKGIRIVEHEIITALVIGIQVFMSIIYTGINDCHFNPGTINAIVMCHFTANVAHTRGIHIFIGCYRKYYIILNIGDPRVLSHSVYRLLG